MLLNKGFIVYGGGWVYMPFWQIEVICGDYGQEEFSILHLINARKRMVKRLD